jgi:redox-sensitive bicupin YhaK (pirin superfamily)
MDGTPMHSKRTISRVIEAPASMEGEGVPIRRAFPSHEVPQLDPFLLFDHFGGVVLKPGEAKGFPDHPHRGFETVTYMLSGEFEHRDSFGHHGVLKAGDVQWMTAGSGLVHSETPAESMVRDGGPLEGFQIWVNLPARDKMKAPKYQELAGREIPLARSADGKAEVKVIAGEALGVRGGAETHIPMQYLHVSLQAGAVFEQQVPSSLNGMLYVFSGAVTVDGKTIPQYHVGALASTGENLTVSADEPAEFLLLAAQPIKEPVARYGPFVMNTAAELQQAFEDYRQGKMGTIG